MEIEGGRWMVVLSGARKDYPPTEPEAYLAFAHSLPDPSLYEAIKEARPLSPIYGYRHTENRRRAFEQLTHFPTGFLVIGDAACSFNPLYGQGMTVAALQAQALGRCLRAEKTPKTRTLQKKVAHVTAFPWQLATSSDARVLQPQQAKGWAQQYIQRLISLLPDDPTLLLTFLQVVHMIRSPLALFHPTILLKVMKRSRSGKRESTGRPGER
jgi:2-polyprenyl-6-methoxyphenol hydroxylase-like FAD-dependent oxidoreductase